MCREPARRRRLSALLAVALGCGATQAEPLKAAARKSFDFTPPKPGEMLPNPASGIGPPPTLAQFTPAAVMSPASAAPRAPTSGAPAAPAAGARPAAPPAVIAPAQARLGEAIARLGIDAVLQHPGSAGPSGPALDKAMLGGLRGSLAKLPPDLAVEADRPAP